MFGNNALKINLFFDVPFNEKTEAKEYGLRWCPINKCWYNQLYFETGYYEGFEDYELPKLLSFQRYKDIVKKWNFNSIIGYDGYIHPLAMERVHNIIKTRMKLYTITKFRNTERKLEKLRLKHQNHREYLYEQKLNIKDISKMMKDFDCFNSDDFEQNKQMKRNLMNIYY